MNSQPPHCPSSSSQRQPPASQIEDASTPRTGPRKARSTEPGTPAGRQRLCRAPAQSRTEKTLRSGTGCTHHVRAPVHSRDHSVVSDQDRRARLDRFVAGCRAAQLRAAETDDDAYEADSTFITQPSPSGQFDTLPSIKAKLSITAFTRLCRALDIGAQYKTYLEDNLGYSQPVVATVLRKRSTKARRPR